MNSEEHLEKVNSRFVFRNCTLKKDYLFDMNFNKRHRIPYSSLYIKCNDVVLMHIREQTERRLSWLIRNKRYLFSYKITESILKELE